MSANTSLCGVMIVVTLCPEVAANVCRALIAWKTIKKIIEIIDIKICEIHENGPLECISSLRMGNIDVCKRKKKAEI